MPIISCIETSADLIENCPSGAETTIGEDVYFVNTGDLISSPQPSAKTATTTAAEWLSVSGTFTFESTKQMSRLEASSSPEYNGETSGERGAKLNKPTLTIPLQRTPAALGWKEKNKNTNCVIVFKDGNGRWCIFGFKGRSASLQKSSNKLGANDAMLNLVFEATTEAHYLPDTFTPQIIPAP